MIYGLVQRGTTEIRYVGRTSKPMNHRLERHIWSSRIRATLVAHWIQSCREEIEMVVLEADALDDRKAERLWIKRLRAEGADLVNENDGGDGAMAGEFKLTDEQRAKISASNARRTYTAETIEKMRRSHMGFRHSVESRRLMSEKRKGIPKSFETRARMAVASRARADQFRGVPLSPEHRAKISEATKGKPKSEAHRQKMREAWQRRKASQ